MIDWCCVSVCMMLALPAAADRRRQAREYGVPVVVVRTKMDQAIDSLKRRSPRGTPLAQLVAELRQKVGSWTACVVGGGRGWQGSQSEHCDWRVGVECCRWRRRCGRR